MQDDGILNVKQSVVHEAVGEPEFDHESKLVSNIQASTLPNLENLHVRQPLFRRTCVMNIVINIDQSAGLVLSTNRCLYQNIIALENDGICVVERDLLLPIDLVVSPKVCLLRYTEERLLESKQQTGQIFQASCIEGITNDMMKAISFAFTSCVMVFEGPLKFLTAAIQSFGYLHAAAIGLDIELQCFISDGASTTSMIVTKVIDRERGALKEDLFPAMPEALTHAEAFLTKFPSINPIAAHAILSSNIGLHKFMTSKVEEQLGLTESFGLSEKSVMLFKQQCQSEHQGKFHRRRRSSTCTSDSGQSSAKNIDLIESSTGKHRREDDIQTEQQPFLIATPLELASVHSVMQSADKNYSQLRNYNVMDNRPTERSSFTHKDITLSALKGRSDTKLKKTVDLILNRHPQLGEPCAKTNFDDSDPCETVEDSNPFKIHHYEYGIFDENSSKDTWDGSFFDADLHLEDDLPTMQEDERHHQSIWRHEEDEDKALFHDLRRSPKESPLQFACSTGVHVKRKQHHQRDDAAMTTVKRSKKCDTGKQTNTSAHFFNRYRFNTAKADDCNCSLASDEPHDLFTGNLHNDATYMSKLPYPPFSHSPRPNPQSRTYSAQRPRSISSSYKSRLSRPFWRASNKQTKVPLCSTNKSSNGKDVLLNPQWTPLDKRAKKVLSFARRGNDRQSQLVWADDNTPKRPKLQFFHTQSFLH